MTTFLSDDWVSESQVALAGLPEIAGADGVVQFVITGSPAGKVQLHVEVQSGRVVSIAGGKHPEPSCTVSLGYADAGALLGGELSTEVAFMTGQAKVEGNHRVWLLDLRPVRRTSEYANAVTRLRSRTEL